MMIMKRCANRRCAIPLLQTSSALHDELEPFLTNGLVLTLNVDPASPWTQVEIVNAEGRPWSSEDKSTMIDLASVDYKSFTESPLHGIPLGMLGKLNVDIQAPDPRDPGQLARAFQQVSRLVDWISSYSNEEGERRSIVDKRLKNQGVHFDGEIQHVDSRQTSTYYIIRPGEGRMLVRGRGISIVNAILGEIKETSAVHKDRALPDICVRLSGNEMDWSREAGFNASIQGPIRKAIARTTGRQVNNDLFQECDVDILLQPFKRIRHSRSLPVELPPHLKSLENPSLSHLINRLSIMGKWQTDFGTRCNHELECQRAKTVPALTMTHTWPDPTTLEISESLSDPCIDNYIQQVEDSWTIWVDYCLDDLDGKTAEFLRCERFSQWSMAYLRKAELVLSNKLFFGYKESGWFTYTIGGPSTKMITIALGKEIELAFFHRTLALKAFNPAAGPTVVEQLDQGQEESQMLSHAAWASRYPTGIPRSSSEAYQDMLRRLTDNQ